MVIPLMVARVKAWLAKGEEVRILTARAHEDGRGPYTHAEVVAQIEAWCLEHIGSILPVTNKKDYGMIDFWDDRARQVMPNTGILVGGRRFES